MTTTHALYGTFCASLLNRIGRLQDTPVVIQTECGAIMNHVVVLIDTRFTFTVWP